MPRLTIKLTGAGRTLVVHREVSEDATLADLERVADMAATRLRPAKREATRLGTDARTRDDD